MEQEEEGKEKECDDDDEWYANLRKQTLVKERRKLNRATETNESLFVQYLVDGGYKQLQLFDIAKRNLFRVGSNVHAGSGPLIWGMTAAQKCDLTLSFERTADSPATVCYINYHGAYYHYSGHLDDCPSGLQNVLPFDPKPQDLVMDQFRNRASLALSMVYPDNVRFLYHVCYECQYFHGNNTFQLNGNQTFDSLKEAVESNPEHIYSRKYNHTLNVQKLIDNIQNEKATGFITIMGGQEKPSEDANDFFGFCVQKYTPLTEELSALTQEQIKHFKELANQEEVEKFLREKQIGVTLNSGTFHSEETISTGYLKWLMKERNFSGFKVTHFIKII